MSGPGPASPAETAATAPAGAAGGGGDSLGQGGAGQLPQADAAAVVPPPPADDEAASKTGEELADAFLRGDNDLRDWTRIALARHGLLPATTATLTRQAVGKRLGECLREWSVKWATINTAADEAATAADKGEYVYKCLRVWYNMHVMVSHARVDDAEVRDIVSAVLGLWATVADMGTRLLFPCFKNPEGGTEKLAARFVALAGDSGNLRLAHVFAEGEVKRDDGVVRIADALRETVAQLRDSGQVSVELGSARSPAAATVAEALYILDLVVRKWPSQRETAAAAHHYPGAPTMAEMAHHQVPREAAADTATASQLIPPARADGMVDAQFAAAAGVPGQPRHGMQMGGGGAGRTHWQQPAWQPPPPPGRR